MTAKFLFLDVTLFSTGGTKSNFATDSVLLTTFVYLGDNSSLSIDFYDLELFILVELAANYGCYLTTSMAKCCIVDFNGRTFSLALANSCCIIFSYLSYTCLPAFFSKTMLWLASYT